MGTTEHPFKGTFNINAVQIPSALFNELSSEAKFSDKGLQITVNNEWNNKNSSILAESYIFADTKEYKPTITINEKVQASFIGEISGAAGALKPTLTYKADSVSIDRTENNAGLICNTLSAGTLDTSSVTFPTSYSVKTTAGAAGGVVGKMKESTKLVLGKADISATVNGETAAGGLVGDSEKATITMDDKVTVSGEVLAAENAGGVIGKAEDSSFTVKEVGSLSVSSSTVTASKENGNAGGVFGYFSVKEEFAFNNQIEIEKTAQITGNTVGGLVGVLINNSDNNTVSVQGNKIDSSLNGKNLGGLIGVYSQTNAEASLKIFSTNVTSTAEALTEEPTYGGMIGLVKNQEKESSYGYIKMDASVFAMSVTDNSANIINYGGVIGTSLDGYFLDFGSVTVTVNDGIDGINCGGLIGNFESGVLRLHGTTDLTKAKIKTAGATKGQIVGIRNNALIYALGDGASKDDTKSTTGWTLKRSAAGKISDIGSYGEVYRPTNNFALEGKNDLLTVNETNHSVTISQASTDISTIKDFAAVALHAQLTQNGAVKFTDSFDFYNAQTRLQLKEDINLTGTGITGFMRDNGRNTDNEEFKSDEGFKGSLDGNEKKITLSIGEVYGMRADTDVTSDTEGSGQIYRHSYTGLFAVTSSAAVKNVTIAGSITIASEELENNYCGTMAARNMGSSLTVKDCSTSVTINYDGNYENSNFYVGGLVGEITAANENNGKLTMTGNKISGSISQTNNSDHARMGGMIGYISRTEDIKYSNKNFLLISPESFTLDLSNTTVNGLKINGNAKTSMGGLLGYDWNNIAVTFRNVTIEGNSSLDSKGSANFGGLVYKATGYWDVDVDAQNHPGINIQSTTFTGNSTKSTDGLLVGVGRNIKAYNYTGVSALYLEIKKDAYKIENTVTVKENENTKFDELVGASLSGDGNRQGIVSLATSDAPKVNTKDTSTTYQNVTKKGSINWEANENTRYYYNLDIIRTNNPSNKESIANEEQLLCWSVRRYAADNIKSYFGSYEENVKLTENINYNMTGYSYYPVSVDSEESLTFDGNGATIQFDNEGFDTKEGAKSTTIMKTNNNSQHKLMQFGLFRDFAASTPTKVATYILSIKNLKLTGSIGNIKESFSGALVCGTVKGSIQTTVINTHSLQINNIESSNLYVTGYTDTQYAPLLVNLIDFYTSVSLNQIKGSYTKNDSMPNHAASSLVGSVGGEKAQNISLSFASMALQDGAKDSKSAMFSRSMLLNSFRYPTGASCAAVYNFNLEDDWENGIFKHHNVTYGKEISESVEYKDQEHWYYDTRRNGKNIYVNTKNPTKTDNAPDFSKYLPYVHVEKNNSNYHEIKVNVYIVDILNGCGTYGHPFQINSAEEMAAIADYIRTGTAGNGWTIRSDEDFLEDAGNKWHIENGDSCSEYTYNGSGWENSDNDEISKEAMREYMRNAYYQIVNDITLDDSFCGLGFADTSAFRGVIVGKKNKNGEYPTITLRNSSLTSQYASHGLINNSYGSVVMNLNIKLSKVQDTNLNENNKTEATVNNYFGGVMGQILGGDNFIENVTVTSDENFLNLTGNCNYLVPVGGYVGIVQGGCLIFRNMSKAGGLSDKEISVDGTAYNAASEDENYFYINPYVGRVLDGCAFYESNETGAVLRNTNKNYYIPTIDPNDEKGISTTVDDNPTSNDKYPSAADKPLFMVTTVKDAQSLLILSAITNSGAAGGGVSSSGDVNYASHAYYGNKKTFFGNTDYGKARNASYQYVGSADSEAQSDFNTSVKDDHNIVNYENAAVTKDSNIPYLVSKYTDSKKMTYFYSANLTRVSLNFEDGNFDMSGYQSGYRGIGGRYRSASIQTEPSKYNADRNTPFIRNFDGNNKNLNLDMTVKEYKNDNYHAIGVGGLFNILQQNIQDTTGKKDIRNEVANLTISGSVELSYYTKNGSKVDSIDSSNSYTVGVGGLVGRSANRGTGINERGDAYYADIKNILLNELKISAPYNAGGIVGLGGVTSYAVNGLQHSKSSANFFAAHFTNCKLENVKIYSSQNAGGLFGWSASSIKDKNSSQNLNPNNVVENCTAIDITVQKDKDDYCSDSAGVFLGKCDGSLTVSASSIKDSSVQANYAGMLSGQIRDNNNNRTLEIEDTTVLDTSSINANSHAGGFVGYSTVSSTIGYSTVSDVFITANIAGGLIGELTKVSDIYGCKVADVKFQNSSSSKVAAALIGKLSGDLTGGNLLWDTNSYEDSITTKGTWIGISSNNIKLAGVSRKNTSSTPLDDVGAGNYSGYISYADYTASNKKNITTPSSPITDYPKAKFENNKITLIEGQFIHLGEGIWSIKDRKNYAEIDSSNLLKAKEKGTVTITNGNSSYTVNILPKEETLLKNGTYNYDSETKRGTVKSNGTEVSGCYVQQGMFDSKGILNENAGSILAVKTKSGYTYSITYGTKGSDGKYPWARMRLRMGPNINTITQGWMSKSDKDSLKIDKKNYTLFEDNEVSIPVSEKGQYIFLNYDNSADANEGYIGYKINEKGDKNLFASITVKTINNSITFDHLKLVSMNNTYFTRGQSIDKDKLGMKFVVYNKDTGVMSSVDNSEVNLDISKATIGTKEIVATYKGLTYNIPITVESYGESDPSYVIYSPKGQYANASIFSGDFGTLYGDAVYNSSDASNNVDLIYKEMKAGKVVGNSNRVLYTTTGVDNFNTTNKLSTYKKEQSTTNFDSDFRVLLVSGNTVSNDIADYLNILTNGGYSKAVSQSCVTAESRTYHWEDSTFKDTKKSSLIIANSGTTNLSYSMGKEYDNDKDQFTLLTLTFKSGNHTQVVYVPIIVRRIVEIDFCATLNEESIFTNSAYENLQSHVLVEYDSNMTGYLSWTYNSSEGQTVEYDWQNFMDSGADLTQGFDKKVKFSYSSGYLPKGSKITLIDVKNQDHVYYYTVEDDDTQSKEISLNSFKDENNKSYQDIPISKLYEASANLDVNGKFVETNATDATVITKDNKYYRLKTDTDKDAQTYKITINNSTKQITENYYIVVNVPKDAAQTAKISSINGAVKSVVQASAPCSVTKVHRYSKTEIDKGEGTESTFSILSSYVQDLEDKSADGTVEMTSSQKININLLNTITFDREQAYGENDALYQEFIVTPYNNEQALSFLQDFGTKGSVHFKVYSKDSSESKQYYKYENGSLTKTSANENCISYQWSSQEGKMKLILGTSNEEAKAIDLSKVRTDIINSKDENSQICVEVTMELTVSQSFLNELVPVSSRIGNTTPEKYLRFQYISKLARDVNKLAESTWRGSYIGMENLYYKGDSGYLKLKFEGDDIKQLGINLNDLWNNKPQVIDATAAIDFNNWTGWKNALEKAQKITFEFHLEQKQNNKRYNTLSNGGYLNYLKVGKWDNKDYTYENILIHKDSSSWTYTQNKENGSFANLQDGIFSLPVKYAVEVSAEQKEFLYANYRLVVEASVYGENDEKISVPNGSLLTDYVTYTIARILKSF